jgi:hypothetical protein
MVCLQLMKCNYITFVNVLEHSGTGWCATCVTNATAGQPGYCGKQSSDELTEEELPVPTFNKGWGYCHTSCKGYVNSNHLL